MCFISVQLSIPAPRARSDMDGEKDGAVWVDADPTYSGFGMEMFSLPPPPGENLAVVYRDLALVVANESTVSTSTFRLGGILVTCNGFSCLLTHMTIPYDSCHVLHLEPSTTCVMDLNMEALCKGINGVFTKGVSLMFLENMMGTATTLKLQLLARRVEPLFCCHPGASLGTGSQVFRQVTWLADNGCPSLGHRVCLQKHMRGKMFVRFLDYRDLHVDVSRMHIRLDLTDSGSPRDCWLEGLDCGNPDHCALPVFWFRDDGEREQVVVRGYEDGPQEHFFMPLPSGDRVWSNVIHETRYQDTRTCLMIDNVEEDTWIHVEIFTVNQQEVTIGFEHEELCYVLPSPPEGRYKT